MQDENSVINHQHQIPIPVNWEKFTYIGQPAQAKVIEQDSQLSDVGRETEFPTTDMESQVSYLSLRSLAESGIGDRVRVVSLHCGEANRRLMAMGLTPGAVLQVISNTLSGSVIVAVQEQRFGLGAEIAQRIRVIKSNWN